MRWQLNGAEITVAELLKDAGYATACIGKWDLSGRAVRAGQMPNDQGFDSYFGPISANDPGKVGLWENRKFVAIEEDMGRLTGLYTDKAVEFIRQNRDHPFFLYLAHTMPHVRIDASAEFKSKSAGGLYGDVIEEIDFNTGRILDALREQGLDRNTYVLFTSDNGPWLSAGDKGGSALPLRDGKGSFWEGGSRVPAVLWGPGKVPAGKTSGEIVATLDILPTFCALSGAPQPTDRTIDGVDQSALFLGKVDSGGRQTFYYFTKFAIGAVLCGVRSDDWKLVLSNREGAGYAVDKMSGPKPLLFNLKNDIGETTDVSADHPEKLAELMKLAEQAGRELGDNEQFGTGARQYPPVPATINWNGEPLGKKP
jgi:arylsulfatase